MFYNYKKLKLFAWFYAFTGCVALTGCASITSEVICGNPGKDGKKIGSRVKTCNSDRSIGDGIVYYLPKRDIRIDVVVASAGSGGGTSDSTIANISNSSSNSINVTINSNTKPDSPTPKPTETKVDAQGDGTSQPGQTEENKKKITVTLSDNRDGETLPDLRNVFLLRYSKNWIGQNNMAVGVSPLGLLTITHADTINKINDIAAYIAIDAAAISTGAGAVIKPTETARTSALPTTTITPGTFTPSKYTATFDKVTTECKAGTYSLLIDPSNLNDDKPQELCGVYVDIEREFENLKYPGNSSWLNPSPNPKYWRFYADNFLIAKRVARNIVAMGPLDQYAFESVPGVFYKQDIPYKVTIYEKEPKYAARFKAFSPNASGVYFAPISETLFTDNTSDITLVNGVVNSLRQNTDSELLGLAKIPASALGAYTNAVGEIFKGIGAVSENESKAQTSELSVLQNAQMITRCQMAIAANNPVGKTGDDLTVAFNAIQTACNSK